MRAILAAWRSAGRPWQIGSLRAVLVLLLSAVLSAVTVASGSAFGRWLSLYVTCCSLEATAVRRVWLVWRSTRSFGPTPQAHSLRAVRAILA